MQQKHPLEQRLREQYADALAAGDAVEVRLTPHVTDLVTQRADHDQKRYGDRHTFTPGRGPDGPTRRLQGTGARAAVAQWLTGQVPVTCFAPWGVNVRWNSYEEQHLKIAAGDRAGTWVRVLGRVPTFWLTGWCWRDEAEQLGVRSEDVADLKRPAWIVEQGALRGMATFRGRQQDRGQR